MYKETVCSNTWYDIEKTILNDKILILELKFYKFDIDVTKDVIDKSSVKWYGEYENEKELLQACSFKCTVDNPGDYDEIYCVFDEES